MTTPAPPARTPEEILAYCREECPELPTRIICDEHFAAYGAALLEEAAMVVDGWHIKRGGYTELAHEIRALAEKHSLAVPEVAEMKYRCDCGRDLTFVLHNLHRMAFPPSPSLAVPTKEESK